MWRNNQYRRICQVETSYFDYERVPGRPVVESVRSLFTLLLVQCWITGAFVTHMRRETVALREMQYSKLRQRKPVGAQASIAWHMNDAHTS